MMFNLIPNPSPDLICRTLDDGTVIVSPQQGKVRVLNETGSLIWSWINGRNTASEITQRLMQRYELPSEQAEREVSDFLADLAERGLLTWEDRPR